MSLRLTILGCGSSGGVPRIGGNWGACDPSNPKNRRSRCSLLVEKEGADGTTRVLIDTSPDMRTQLLAADVGTVDAVVYTHPHADHIHGLDDLRMVYFNTKQRIPVWADAATEADLRARFGYAFVQPEWSSYPPILEMNQIKGPFDISGAGGTIPFTPIRVEHGDIYALGFRMENTVYMPDVNEIPEDAWASLESLDLWIIDALRYTPHPSHAHLDKTLEWIKRAGPKQSIITNMHVDIDYDTVRAQIPNGVTPAFDGMQVTIP
ncbi:MAG: MBL fold metallo-hydrolase [Planktomarina sp.]